MNKAIVTRIAPLAMALTVVLSGATIPLASAAPLPAKHTMVRAATQPVWATYNAKTKTADLTLISAYGKDTYNFNGGMNGHFVFTIPVGAHVVVTYRNMSMHMPHGAEVVAYTGKLPLSLPPPPPAFAGAASPNYRHGTMRGIVQHFSFTASKAGTYLLICPVHNHVKFGHWSWFIVSSTAKTATGVLK